MKLSTGNKTLCRSLNSDHNTLTYELAWINLAELSANYPVDQFLVSIAKMEGNIDRALMTAEKERAEKAYMLTSTPKLIDLKNDVDYDKELDMTPEELRAAATLGGRTRRLRVNFLRGNVLAIAMNDIPEFYHSLESDGESIVAHEVQDNPEPTQSASAPRIDGSQSQSPDEVATSSISNDGNVEAQAEELVLRPEEPVLPPEEPMLPTEEPVLPPEQPVTRGTDPG
ncbi:hypothetical protein QAD02_018284 [Eretmocerus hayati]|uniref:Uncharacterized protein n=1 Tax=Eretmocerus hayati TaxID=131215 RepID=A0ACC2PGL3_9HYME|nr:hypothetical protein QAD02_018284 [Eretmocerus hayati]